MIRSATAGGGGGLFPQLPSLAPVLGQPSIQWGLGGTPLHHRPSFHEVLSPAGVVPKDSPHLALAPAGSARYAQWGGFDEPSISSLAGHANACLQLLQLLRCPWFVVQPGC